MTKVLLSIGGMSCAACAQTVEKALKRVAGVQTAQVNLVLAQASVEYDQTRVSLDQLAAAIEKVGYQSLGEAPSVPTQAADDHQSRWLVSQGIWLIILIYTAMAHMVGLPVVPWLHMLNFPSRYALALLLMTGPFLWWGRTIGRAGLKHLFTGHPNMDSLITLGVSVSFIYSLVNTLLVITGRDSSAVERLYYDSVAMTIYFVNLGHFWDKRAKVSAAASLQGLIQITPPGGIQNYRHRGS